MTKDETEIFIKVFQNDKKLYYMLVTQNNGKRLLTCIPASEFRKVKAKIDNADLIQTFNGSASKNPNELNGLTKGDYTKDSKIKQDFTPNIRVKTQNLKLENLESIFKNSNTDKVNGELFDKVFSVAKDLKVEYSNEILGNRNILGQYNAKNNKITLQDFSSETILHEMIHAVSSRAIDNPQVLKPVQKHAIKSLNRIYNRLKLDSKFKGEYALGSVKEMVAELSNPAFRDKLKSRNLWQRIIDSIANLFGFRKDSSNYAKISKNLSDIIDNYDTNFTKSYENANFESKNIDFAKKNTLESNLDSNQGKNMDFIYKTSEVKTFKELRNNTKEVLSNITHENIQNKETGIIAKITNAEIKKMISQAAVDKSIANGFTKEEHFALCNDIKNLFINAKLREKHKDLHGRNNITTHRFAINTIVNGKKAIAKITAHVRKVGNNKIYSLELENIVKPAIKD